MWMSASRANFIGYLMLMILPDDGESWFSFLSSSSLWLWSTYCINAITPQGHSSPLCSLSLILSHLHVFEGGEPSYDFCGCLVGHAWCNMWWTSPVLGQKIKMAKGHWLNTACGFPSLEPTWLSCSQLSRTKTHRETPVFSYQTPYSLKNISTPQHYVQGKKKLQRLFKVMTLVTSAFLLLWLSLNLYTP